MSLESIKNLVKTDFKEVDKIVTSSLRSHINLISEVGTYMIKGGGKRLRPLLVLLCARAIGYKGTQHLALAAVVEFIHTATLLHDDVIDDSELRRGRKTANYIWSNEASILVGDFLYSRAFQMMLQVGNLDILQIFADATNTIAEGEILQLINKNNPDTSETNYLDVIRCKTAKLFEAATEFCAILKNCPAAVRATIAQFGLHLGIAFQLIDDLLDYQKPHNELGKAIGKDLSDGKPTLPIIYLLKYGTSKEKEMVHEAISTGNVKNFAAIQYAIARSGAIEYTVNLAKKEGEVAKKAIAELAASPYQEAALALVDFAILRQH